MEARELTDGRILEFRGAVLVTTGIQDSGGQVRYAVEHKDRRRSDMRRRATEQGETDIAAPIAERRAHPIREGLKRDKDVTNSASRTKGSLAPT